MHTKNQFEVVSNLFCDGISINDIVFATTAELESFFAERGIHIFLTQRSWTQKKTLASASKKYFLRIRDENATISDEWFQKLAKAMNDLRAVDF